MKEKKYRVYFKQINQEMFEVEAKNTAEAVAKAVKKWQTSNEVPVLDEIEEVRKQPYKIYVCPKCKKQLKEEDMGKRCPFCKEWQYEHTALREVKLCKKK